MNLKRNFFIGCSFVLGMKSFSQTAVSEFVPSETFNPVSYSPSPAEYRSNAGKPGSKYWQNKADYEITVKLDTATHRIEGKVTIQYTNNSPDKLNFIWLQLDQNVRKTGSRDTYLRNAISQPDSAFYTTGFTIESVKIKDGQNTYSPEYLVEDTRMQIRLQEAQPGHGKKISITISYHFVVPEKDPVRMGRQQLSSGWVYQIGQWYPRMVVYDDMEGWNTFPYIQASEFYLEYGDFNYAITLPANMIVVGSGKLINEREVLPMSVQKKLKKASESDSTSIVAEPGDLPVGKQKLRTWKFACISARDVAWAASAGFIWDAAKMNLPANRKAVAMSVYPLELRNKWSKSTQMTRYTIEYNSNKWYPYPYPFAVNVAGSVFGMEYPGLAFCANASIPLISHEFSHTWFPMIVGSNERKHAWMDEGLTSFLTSMVVEDYRKTMNIARTGAALKENYHSKFTGNALMNFPLIAGDSYGKTELALKLLRNIVLGHERFDFALKQYIKDWAFKHPTPWDFFSAMENASGEDLDWFWRGWIINNWKFDQSVHAIKYIDSTNLGKGSMITIRNNEKMALPLYVTVIQEDNTRLNFQFPVEIWMKGGDWRFRCNSTGRITEVIIDEKELLPDINRKNNTYKADKLIAQQGKYFNNSPF
jgi:hypothetical protein